MKKKFLKRFERLENIPNDLLIKKGMKVSRRFERLEVGEKKIEIAITDKISREEKAPLKVRSSIFCPYCGMENSAEALNCDFCKHNLKNELAENYQDKAGLLIECECGAKNQRGRPYCWICGKYLGSGEPVKAQSDNVISLTIDGVEYRSDNENLPLDIKILMERIRKNGYSKQLVDEWLKEREKIRKIDIDMVSESRQKTFDRESRIRELRFALIGRGFGLVIFIIFVIFQLSTCQRIFR